MKAAQSLGVKKAISANRSTRPYGPYTVNFNPRGTIGVPRKLLKDVIGEDGSLMGVFNFATLLREYQTLRMAFIVRTISGAKFQA